VAAAEAAAAAAKGREVAARAAGREYAERARRAETLHEEVEAELAEVGAAAYTACMSWGHVLGRPVFCSLQSLTCVAEPAVQQSLHTWAASCGAGMC
jgi:hypothetical protein